MPREISGCGSDASLTVSAGRWTWRKLRDCRAPDVGQTESGTGFVDAGDGVSTEGNRSERLISHWTAIGVAVSILVQIIIGAWVISGMNTRINDIEVRVQHVELYKANSDAITPQLDEINRRLSVIEANTIDRGPRNSR